MKKEREPTGSKQPETKRARIHPIVIYPFVHPSNLTDIQALYDDLIKVLAEDSEKYARPLTVMTRQTYYNTAVLMKNVPPDQWQQRKDRFLAFLENTVKEYSDLRQVWSVDTCHTWLDGLGHAFENCETHSDVYWLIPADFNYGSAQGREVIKRLPELPAQCYERQDQQDFCIGQIALPPNSSKQLIDTYGTYGLLYNWFPAEAQEIRKITDKPRSEFFAIGHNFLDYVLGRRWYAYEQTIVILLSGMHGPIPSRRIRKIDLAEVTDLPQGRDTLAGAMQQIERTERVLKLYWREINEARDPLWPEKFRKLDLQSEQIRGAALVIMDQILR